MRTTGWMTTKLVLAIATALAIAAPTVHAQTSFSTKQFGIGGGATAAAARGNIVIPEGTLSSRHLVPSESFRNLTGRLARADAEEGGGDNGGGGTSGGDESKDGGGVAGGSSGGDNTTTGNTVSRDPEGPASGSSGGSSGSSGGSSTTQDNVNTRGDGKGKN